MAFESLSSSVEWNVTGKLSFRLPGADECDVGNFNEAFAGVKLSESSDVNISFGVKIVFVVVLIVVLSVFSPLSGSLDGDDLFSHIYYMEIAIDCVDFVLNRKQAEKKENFVLQINPIMLFIYMEK